ncbi:MAG: hypothetical protein Q8P24_05055, partial [Desulfobacterales bacterium]|nr:hypothetical protein [Desulfobacterales bacterium]
REGLYSPLHTRIQLEIFVAQTTFMRWLRKKSGYSIWISNASVAVHKLPFFCSTPGKMVTVH